MILHIITGAPGAGKTTTLDAFLALNAHYVAFDIDWLIHSASDLAQRDIFNDPTVWPAYGRVWFDVLQAIVKNGQRPVFFTPNTPEDLAELEQPTWCTGMRWILLDCPDSVRMERLIARDGWEYEKIQEALDDAAELRMYNFLRLDSSLNTPDEIARQVLDWLDQADDDVVKSSFQEQVASSEQYVSQNGQGFTVAEQVVARVEPSVGVSSGAVEQIDQVKVSKPEQESVEPVEPVEPVEIEEVEGYATENGSLFIPEAPGLVNIAKEAFKDSKNGYGEIDDEVEISESVVVESDQLEEEPIETLPEVGQIRPKLHFTPPQGWMNDPNGLLYHAGEYHLFYQYNPDDLVWGAMYWGHAVSRDLINWEHVPIALYPAEDGAVFSGTAVIDTYNTAGFGEDTMIAIFTLHQAVGDQTVESQGLAYSHDKGRTWTKYAENPVIAMPNLPHNDFRDPKVFWWGKPESGHWVMVLAVKDEVWFYTSSNLKNWERVSTFGQSFGSHAGIWECPDLFELQIENSEKKCWILLVSVNGGAPAGGSGVQYFIGNFDGKSFTPIDPFSTIRWLDYGPDYYAAVTYNHAPSGRRILIGWMNNSAYSHDIPAEDWRGMQSLPREIFASAEEDRLRLHQRPIEELEGYWTDQIRKGPFTLNGSQRISEFAAAVAEYNIIFQLDEDTTANTFGIRVRCGDNKYTEITYSIEDRSVDVNRSKMGEVVPKMSPSRLFNAPLEAANKIVTLNVVVDHESVEVWGNNGEVFISLLNYPLRENIEFELFSKKGRVEVVSAVCRKKG